MDSFEEKVVFGLGCALGVLSALCFIPATRRRLAGAAKPMLDKVGRAEPSEIAADAGKAAVAAAAAEGGKRFLGV